MSAEESTYFESRSFWLSNNVHKRVAREKTFLQ